MESKQTEQLCALYGKLIELETEFRAAVGEVDPGRAPAFSAVSRKGTRIMGVPEGRVTPSMGVSPKCGTFEERDRSRAPAIHLTSPSVHGVRGTQADKAFMQDMVNMITFLREHVEAAHDKRTELTERAKRRKTETAEEQEWNIK